MSADPTPSDGDHASRGADAIPDDLIDRDPLTATVVRYEHRPDRCTVSPADVADERRLTAWLSIDTDALVSLDDAR